MKEGLSPRAREGFLIQLTPYGGCDLAYCLSPYQHHNGMPQR